MTVVNPKSISGITSITTASGSDNLLTIHTNDGTERVRVDSTGTTKIVTGIVTTLTATGSAKVGSGVTLSPDGDIFSTGISTVKGIHVNGTQLGEDLKVGTGVTITRDGDVFTTGVSTFSSNVNIGVGTTGFVTITPDAAIKATFRGTSGQDVIMISTGSVAGNGDTFANVRGNNRSGIRIRGGGSYDGGAIELAGGLRDSDPGIIKFETGTGSSVTERLRITSTGQVNIGAASPTASENGQLNVYTTTSGGKAQIVHSAGQGGLRLAGTGSGSGSNLIFSNDYNSGTFSDHWCIQHDGGDDYLKFRSGGTGGSQRVQLRDNGHILDYRDSNGNVFEYYRVSTSLFVVDNLSNESNTRMRIRNPNGTINYNSSSDYRLKENDVKITDGITRLKKLRPITFKWKNGTNTYDGFFAHEVSEACPMAVDGTKDQVATADDVSEGNANNVGDPIYQGIDHGKMVPLLTAALQEAVARIEALEGS